MKAKEYYVKYHDQLLSEDDQNSLEAISSLIYDLSVELKSLCEIRNAKTDNAARSIVRELNDKYNAIVALFEAKDGGSPIRPNGFLTFWEHKLPGLARVNKTATRLSDMAKLRVEAGLGYSEGVPHRTHNIRTGIDFSNPNALTTLAMLGNMVTGS